MNEPEQKESAPAAPAPQPAPPAAGTPAAENKPDRGKSDRGRPKGGGGGGMPRRRTREAVPSLEDDLRFKSGPKLSELDAEIADELEAAMGGMSQKDLVAADSSRQVQ